MELLDQVEGGFSLVPVVVSEIVTLARWRPHRFEHLLDVGNDEGVEEAAFLDLSNVHKDASRELISEV